MKIGAIYYTDFHIDSKIRRICQKQLQKSFKGEIISVSLNKPLDLGKNIVLLNRERSYPTMCEQILMALEASTADYIFFTEHDVLYHPSHFDFVPADDTIYYYNFNHWRWDFPNDRIITYDQLTSLSSMVCNRKLALEHYKKRLEAIEKWGWAKDRSREPRWGRRIGYEPGTKKIKRGGFSDDSFVKWKSVFPNVDLRHKGTFSSPKTRLKDFTHAPTNFQETTLDTVPGWNLKEMFGL